MLREDAKNIHEKVLKVNDPEAWERISHFAFEEVQDDVDLPNKTKLLSNLAYLLGMQGLEEYRLMLPVALDNGISPVEAKEVVYQAVDYLGLGRVMPFFEATNQILLDRGVKMKDFAKKGIINKWLVDNCFGDYYTRKGLDDKEREMITFCYLAAQGGCEPQLLAHAKANVGLGNDQQFLTKVVLANVPFIGYPRSLNAINVINQVK